VYAGTLSSSVSARACVCVYITLRDDAAAAAEGCQMVKLAPDTRPFYTPHPVGVVVGSGRAARQSRPSGMRRI